MSLRRAVRDSIVLSFCVFVLACSGNSARVGSVSSLTANTAEGKDLYTSNCSSCHGSDGRSGSAGRDIASAASRNSSGTIDAILSGTGRMPAFSNLSDQQVADVVGYLKGL